MESKIKKYNMKICWIWLIIKENQILMIKRSKNKPINNYPNYWAFPWWWQISWESPEETVIREIKEEIWTDFIITKLFIENKTKSNTFYYFLWEISWKIIIQEEECDWYWWFTYNEAKKLLMSEWICEIIEKLNIEWLI
jgi:ADP-ribose pyrophosphatase YjhB (NUDIX family)